MRPFGVIAERLYVPAAFCPHCGERVKLDPSTNWVPHPMAGKRMGAILCHDVEDQNGDVSDTHEWEVDIEFSLSITPVLAAVQLEVVR